MSKPCTEKKLGRREDTRKPNLPVSAAFAMANQANNLAPTPTPTRGVQARTSVPSLAASLHRRHRTCKGQHPGQPPWKQPGSEWVSEAHIQTCFITKQNRGQQKPENSDSENTYISKHALQSISACEEKQVTETTVILCRSHGHGLAM